MRRRRRRPKLALLLVAAVLSTVAALESAAALAEGGNRFLQAAAVGDGDSEDHDFSLPVSSGDGDDEDHDFSVPEVTRAPPETGGDADSSVTPSASGESSSEDEEGGDDDDDDDSESSSEQPVVTRTPSLAPTAAPVKPTGEPDVEPTDMPVLEPTEEPTVAPAPGSRTPGVTQAPATTTAPDATSAPTITTAPDATSSAPTRRPIVLPTDVPSKEPSPALASVTPGAPSTAPSSSAPSTTKPVRPITLPTEPPTEQPSQAPAAVTPDATTKTPDVTTDAPTRNPSKPIVLPTVIPVKTPSPAPELVTPSAPATTYAPTRKPIHPITLPTVIPVKTPTPAPESVIPAVPTDPAITEAPTRKPIIPITLPTVIPVKTPSPVPETASPSVPTDPATTEAPTRKPIIPIVLPTLIPVKTESPSPETETPGSTTPTPDAPTRKPIIPIVLPTLIPTTKQPTLSPSAGSGGADDTAIKPPASLPPSVGPGVVPAPVGPAPGNATAAPPRTRVPIDWDLIKDNNSTRRPGAGSGGGAGTVVAPDLGPAKPTPPADNTVPPKANTTIATPTPTPVATKKPSATKKNQTVTTFEDEDAGTDTKSTSFKVDEKATVTVTDGSKKQTYKKYDRNTMAELMKGDKSSPIATEHEDPSATDDSADLISGNIIGGSNRNNPPPGADIEVSAFAAHAQDAIRYSSYAFSLVSFGLLVAFHLLALKSPSWLIESASARRTSGSWFMPATWELVAVMTYYQHLGSISMLELTKAPYIILDFTDSFSWMNFHTHSIVTSTTRRLEFIILTGIVSYSDRLGIDEGTLLETTTKFFVVLAVIVVAIFGVFAGLRIFNLRKNRESVSEGGASKWMAWKDSFAVCILGVGVAIWLIGVYPLITVSTYELTMQIRYQISGELVLAMINMFVVVVAGLCFLFYKVRSIRAAAAFQYSNHGIYGTLYADSKQTFRYFFVGVVLFQAIIGVLTGGIQDVPDQLVALLVAHVLFTAVLIYLAPFVDKRVQILIVLLNVFRIVNLSMSFAFLTVSELETSSRAVVAHAFVVFNFAVVLLLFLRHIGIFVVTLRKWTQSHSTDEKHSMLAPEVHNEAGQGFEGGLRFSTSIVRGPNNSMHC